MTDGPRPVHDDRFDELAVGWALHALEPGDAEAFETHLPTCPRCRGTVEETLAAMGSMATTVPDAEPPAGLRSRLLAAVDATEQDPGAGPASSTAGSVLPLDRSRRRGRARRRLTGVLLAASVAAVVGLGIWSVVLAGARDDAEDAARAQAAVVSALLSPGEATVTPVTDDDGRALATVLVRDDGTRLVTHGLSVNDADDSTYVLWGIRDGDPEALGTFDVTDDGISLHPVPAEPGADGYSGYGISLEPGRAAPPAPTDVVATGQVPA